MRFWVNNDRDGVSPPASANDPGRDFQPSIVRDFSTGIINCQPDLEDFARLWICGLPAFPVNGGYTTSLAWRNTSGTPRIRLYNAYESDGGTRYLTDTNVAAMQSAAIWNGQTWIGWGQSLAEIAPGQPYIQPAPFLAGTQCYLFEGGGVGSGELVLTVSQGTNVIAQTSAWLDLHDVKDLYERAIITNITTGAISNWTSVIQTVQYPVVSDANESQDIVLYVHGALNTEGTWLMRSDTVTKRLYWAGYHGKFASVRWPSIIIVDLSWYNLSELYGYKAATAFKDYLTQLRNRFPNYRLHVLAHSQGGTTASETMSEGAPFDTLILSQVSMPASCYDVDAPTNADLVARDTPPLSTPEWRPMGYRGAHTNMAGRVVNFFATNDYNLDLWLTYQKVFKPSDNYSYDGTNCWYRFDPEHDLYRLVTDAQESRAMISRSRTLGIGAQGPSVGQTGQGIIQSAVDVQSQFGFGATLKEHSAFFIRPIQTIRPYYQQVLTSCQIQPAP